MRTALNALMLMATDAAQAHSYRVGDLEILHPAIMVPQANSALHLRPRDDHESRL